MMNLKALKHHPSGASPPTSPTIPPPDSCFVVDTFSDTVGTTLDVHTGETGATWTLDAWFDGDATYVSDMNIATGGYLTIPSGKAPYERAALASGVPPSYNYFLEMTIEAMLAPNEEHVAIVARMTADGQWFFALMIYPNMADASMHIDLLAVSDFNDVTTTVYTGSALAAGEHTIRWDISEENHVVKVDGATVATFVSTAAIEAGFVGLVSDNTIDAVALDPVSIPISSFRACELTFPGRTYFVRDEFIGDLDTLLIGSPSHVGETGATWSTAPAYDDAIATPALDGDGSAYVIPDAFAGSLFGVEASGTPPSADYFVEGRFLAGGVSGTGHPAFHLLARMVDGNNLYECEVSATTGTLGIDVLVHKIVAGVGPTQIAVFQDGLTGTFYNSTHTVRLKLVSDSITVDLDGVQVISTTDSGVAAAGSVGFAITEPGTGRSMTVQRFTASGDV